MTAPQAPCSTVLGKTSARPGRRPGNRVYRGSAGRTRTRGGREVISLNLRVLCRPLPSLERDAKMAGGEGVKARARRESLLEAD